MRAVRAGRAALFLRSKRCACASFAVASRRAFRQAKAAWPAAKRARIFEARHSFLIPGTGLKRRRPIKSAPRCRKAGCSTRPFRHAGRRAKIARRSACAPRLSIHCFLRSKRCPRASFAVASMRAFRQAKAAWPLAKRARIFEPRHSFLIPDTGLKRRIPAKSAPRCRKADCSTRPFRHAGRRAKIVRRSACAPPPFHPLLFALKALRLRVIRRCFKARIPTGESGATHCKARPNFRTAPFVSHPRHWP